MKILEQFYFLNMFLLNSKNYNPDICENCLLIFTNKTNMNMDDFSGIFRLPVR